MKSGNVLLQSLDPGESSVTFFTLQDIVIFSIHVFFANVALQRAGALEFDFRMVTHEGFQINFMNAVHVTFERALAAKSLLAFLA